MSRKCCVEKDGDGVETRVENVDGALLRGSKDNGDIGIEEDGASVRLLSSAAIREKI
jgi:hypothetical protein